MAQVIKEATAQGIVHRDLKLANLMVSRKGRVRVTDFGIARWAENSVAVSQSGTIAGTPQYMSPEQIEARPAAPANDIYSAGCPGFEHDFGCSHTGRPAFGFAKTGVF